MCYTVFKHAKNVFIVQILKFNWGPYILSGNLTKTSLLKCKGAIAYGQTLLQLESSLSLISEMSILGHIKWTQEVKFQQSPFKEGAEYPEEKLNLREEN